MAQRERTTQTVAEVAAAIGARLVRGDGERRVADVAPLEDAGDDDLTFLANPKYLARVAKTRAGAAIIPADLAIPPDWPPGLALLAHENPYLAFTRALSRLRPEPPPPPPGIHPSAVVAESASVPDDVHVGAQCAIGERASIGAGSVILPGCFVGDDVAVGAGCRIGPNVSVLHGTTIGDRVRVQAQSTIGSDGFGYAMDGGVRERIPQVGTVVIEDDVEIGAGVTVDRATMGVTRIGARTKIDNLVQIAHNVKIGVDCVIVAQVGISGSTKLGDKVILAGQAGVVGHLELGDGVIVAAQSGVAKSAPAGAVLFGSPALEMAKQRRVLAVQHKLPEYVKTIRDLERRLIELERRSGKQAATGDEGR